MTELFLKIVNMSIAATWLVLAVLLLRLCLKKAPRWVHVLLWGIVAVRLLCPFSIESALSLIPSTEVISPDIMMDRTPQITTGIPAINSMVNPIISESFAPAPMASANPLQIWIPVIAGVWIMGMALMSIYTAVSCLYLHHRVRTATKLYGRIFQSAHIPSPFVLGIFRPRIYLPYGMNERDMSHVIAHEQTHIRRKDHWWKPLGFLLLTVHWFNPLMWVAYILLCRDIELACDEKVIRELGHDQRADYSQALLSCSVSRRMIAACPLAFGEVGVKERVKNVLSYRKPAFWVIVLAVVICIAVAVCFLTDPAASRDFPMEGSNVADLDPRLIVDTIAEMEGLDDGFQLYVNGDNFDLHLKEDFELENSGAIRFFYYDHQQEYSAQLRLFLEEEQFYVTEPTAWTKQDRIFLFYHYLQALQFLPQDAIRDMCPDADGYIVTQLDEGSPDDYERLITYSDNGAGEIYGWLIHLELQPLHDVAGGGQRGTGEEVIHLFYGDGNVEVDYGMMEWFDYVMEDEYDFSMDLEMDHPAYGGVTFRCNGVEITAEDDHGETVLITGMPIWNAFFTDLTGDSYPEICATVSFGSGLIDTHVVVYDYVNGREYTLWDRGSYDYSLRLEDETLLCDQFTFPNSWPLNQDSLVATGKLILADAGGGDGKQLTMDFGAFKPVIVSIEDRTVTEQLPTDDAVEVFYEDAEYEYSFASIRSHLVTVTYNNGTSEDIKTALEAGRAAIQDLDTFGIHYYVEPKQTAMQPTQTNLRGLYAGYLFTSINGATYRYSLTDPKPANVTADRLLDTFTEETHIEGIVWEVYSLREYPDKTKLLLISGSNSSWLCEYAPSGQAEEGALQAAREAGYVIVEDGRLTGGEDTWQAFYESSQKGDPGFVYVAHYHTLDPERTAPSTYEAYRQDYPALYVHELSFDGEQFVLRTEDDVRTYEYLMKYSVSGTPLVTSAEHKNISRYVLTHDNTHTWEQLWRSLASSVTGAAIDHYTVCTEDN